MAHLIVCDTVSFRAGIQDLVKGEKELAIKVSNVSCTLLNQQKIELNKSLIKFNTSKFFNKLVQQDTVTFLMFDYLLPGLLLTGNLILSKLHVGHY